MLMIEIIRRIESRGFDALMTAPVYHVIRKSGTDVTPSGLVAASLQTRNFICHETGGCGVLTLEGRKIAL
jgi:hypothetical protein